MNPVFQENMRILYAHMVSVGKKYIGEDVPENIWWCVEKNKKQNEHKSLDEIMKILAKKDGVTWQITL